MATTIWVTDDYLRAKELLGEAPLIFDNPKLMTDDEAQARFEQMWFLYNTHNWSLSRVGRAFGELQKESVRQVFRKHGQEARPANGSSAFRELRRARRLAQQVPEAAVST